MSGVAAADRLSRMREAFGLLQSGRFGEAAASAALLLAADPRDMEAALLRGLAAGALESATGSAPEGVLGSAPEGALGSAPEGAVGRTPGDAPGGTGQAEEAAALLVRVGRARPGHAHPVRDLLALLRRIGRDAAAGPVLRAALRLDPGDARLHGALAEWLYEHGRPEEALPVIGPWLRLAPDAFEAHNLLGAVLADLGRMAEADARFRHAIALAPENASGWANLGMTLKTEGRFDEALAAFREAVQRRPGDVTVRLNHAIALLRAGRLAQGWAEFEARLATPGHTTLPPARLLPALASLAAPASQAGGLAGRVAEPGGLRGRTVLVTHEEGFGDTLQFVRYVPMLVARGARVLLSVPRELARLLRGTAGVEVLAGDGQWLPHYDWHCPVLSLPRAFGTTLETIPATLPYLRADPALVRFWAARLPPRPEGPGVGARGLRVGIAWAGQARTSQLGFAAIDRRRSMALEALAPLAAVPGLRLVSLQKGASAAAFPPGMALCDPMPDVSDFADTAAIVASLDLVVSVDTAVAHLAGGLGKPVFLLDRYDSCWRWLSGREDSPWYPRLRVFRQARMGDWAEVVGRVVEALEAAVAAPWAGAAPF